MLKGKREGGCYVMIHSCSCMCVAQSLLSARGSKIESRLLYEHLRALINQIKCLSEHFKFVVVITNEDDSSLT